MQVPDGDELKDADAHFAGKNLGFANRTATRNPLTLNFIPFLAKLYCTEGKSYETYRVSSMRRCSAAAFFDL